MGLARLATGTVTPTDTPMMQRGARPITLGQNETCTPKKLGEAERQSDLPHDIADHRHSEIVFDKFHMVKHLQEALDTVRKNEYSRLDSTERSFIKGQKYNLLTRWENLRREGRASLQILLKENRRLYPAYLLKETFGSLWDYNTPAWAWKIFDNGRSSLRWQRLKPYEKFARMVERHWAGIASYGKPENKVALGFVEGINNKVRTIQRRAYDTKTESTSASKS